MINNYYIVFITITTLVVSAHKEALPPKFTKLNTINNLQEVPDSSLLLLDRIRLTRASNQSEHVRLRKLSKQSQNSTTAPPATAPSRRCQCAAGVCKCCTGAVLDFFNQKACLRISYHPTDFAFDVTMSMNDRILYENSLSGKSPKPFCISPPRFTNLKVCSRIYNVFFPGRNFHFCLSMYGQWSDVELFNISFDCLRVGANGFATLKPEDDGGISIANYGPQQGVDAVINSGYDDIEDYNENVVRSLLDVFDYDDD